MSSKGISQISFRSAMKVKEPFAAHVAAARGMLSNGLVVSRRSSCEKEPLAFCAHKACESLKAISWKGSALKGDESYNYLTCNSPLCRRATDGPFGDPRSPNIPDFDRICRANSLTGCLELNKLRVQLFLDRVNALRFNAEETVQTQTTPNSSYQARCSGARGGLGCFGCAEL